VVASLLALERTPVPDLVDELVQEVWCRFLERDRRALRGCRRQNDGELLTYLRRVCRSVVVDQLRLRGTIKRGGAAAFVTGTGEEGDDLLERIADPAWGPERRAAVREGRRRFLESCASLLADRPARDLEIFRLAVVDGWTSREIAERLDGELRPGSIDSVVHRQRRFLESRGVRVPTR